MTDLVKAFLSTNWRRLEQVTYDMCRPSNTVSPRWLANPNLHLLVKTLSDEQKFPSLKKLHVRVFNGDLKTVHPGFDVQVRCLMHEAVASLCRRGVQVVLERTFIMIVPTPPDPFPYDSVLYEKGQYGNRSTSI